MKDQLSALIDGEIAPEEAHHLITGAGAGGELKEAWQHYHLIGDVMRGERPGRANTTSRIMAAIDAEPVVPIPVATKPVSAVAKKTVPRLWSVAASVAAVAFVGTALWQNHALQADNLAPVQIAQDVPMEYLVAHQAAAPSGTSYYIQSAVYNNESK